LFRKYLEDNDFLRKSFPQKENMSLLGYAYLHPHLELTAFDPSTYARQGAVTRVTATRDGLLAKQGQGVGQSAQKVCQHCP
jgi:hypothetical protein